jgi:hypothetical protein
MTGLYGRSTVFVSRFHAQVPPLGIGSVYEDELLFPSPILELLFTCDRIGCYLMRLEVNEPRDVVASRVTHHALAMFFQPTGQVRRHADIKRTPVLTGENIDDWIALHVGTISDCMFFVTTINSCIAVGMTGFLS